MAARLAAMAAGWTSRPPTTWAAPAAAPPARASSSRQGLPLRLPPADGPLVLGHQGGLQDRHQGEGPAAGGAGPRRPSPDCACGAAPTTRRRRTLGHLADLVLGQQDHVACRSWRRCRPPSRGRRPGRTPAGGRCATAAPVRPGPAGGRRRAGLPARPIPARPACRPPRRAARPGRAGPASCGPGVVQPASHPAALRPKVIGRACCSRVRPAITRSAVGAGQTAHPSAGPPERGVDRGQGPAGDEHGGGVQNVLAGRPPVHPGGGRSGHRGAESGHQGDDRVAVPSRRPAEGRPGRIGRPGRRPRSPRRPRPGSRRQSASARASAASASSIACSQASSPVAARSSSVARIGRSARRARSPVKEHRLVIALQADVEAQPGGIGRGRPGWRPGRPRGSPGARDPTRWPRASSGK